MLSAYSLMHRPASGAHSVIRRVDFHRPLKRSRRWAYTLRRRRSRRARPSLAWRSSHRQSTPGADERGPRATRGLPFARQPRAGATAKKRRHPQAPPSLGRKRPRKQRRKATLRRWKYVPLRSRQDAVAIDGAFVADPPQGVAVAKRCRHSRLTAIGLQSWLRACALTSCLRDTAHGFGATLVPPRDPPRRDGCTHGWPGPVAFFCVKVSAIIDETRKPLRDGVPPCRRSLRPRMGGGDTGDGPLARAS
jgi:hypothetical protein